MNPLVDTAIKVSVVMLIALAAAVLLRRRSAALRHRMLAAAVVCAALMPAARWVVPEWAVPFEAWTAPETPMMEVEPARPELVVNASADELPRRGSSPFGVSALVALWIAGVVVTLTTLLVGLIRLAQLTARSTPVSDDRWTLVANELARTHRLRRPAALLVCEHPSLLVTWGFWRPTVLLPSGAREWPESRIRATLTHEIAHVQRRDWSIHILGQVLRCLHWFNPIVWQACRRLRRESEHACDAAVLRSGIAAADYATTLLDVASTAVRARRAPGCALAMAQPSTLEHRVRAILGGQLNTRPPYRHELALATYVLVAASIPVAGYAAGSRHSPLQSAQAPSHQDERLTPASATSVSSSSANRTAASSPADDPSPNDSPVRIEPPTSAVAPDADAARASATISGVVRDPAGRAMRNVDVELQLISTQSAWHATTDEQGAYSFPGLAAGRYQLKASYPAFSIITTAVDLGEDESQVRNVTLRIGTVIESITVVAGRPASAPSVGLSAGARVPGPGPGTSVSSVPSAGSAPRGPGECIDGTGGCFMPPRKIKDVKPVYPVSAQESGSEGVVILEGTIDTDGTISALRTLRGLEGLSEAAQEAVRQWEYVPAKLNGGPIAIIVAVTVNFTLK